MHIFVALFRCSFFFFFFFFDPYESDLKVDFEESIKNVHIIMNHKGGYTALHRDTEYAMVPWDPLKEDKPGPWTPLWKHLILSI